MPDFGPSLHHNGSILHPIPGGVTLHDRPDPERPGHIIRGATRRMVMAELLSEGRITKRQHDAGDRLLDDLCRAQGGSQASFLAAVTSGGGSREGASPRQSRALRAVSRVRLMLGLAPHTVTWWVVLDNKTPRAFDDEHRLEHGTGMKWLRVALDTLDTHYNDRG